MKKILCSLLAALMLLSSFAAFAEETDTSLTLIDIGMFSAGGTVTEPVEGEYDDSTPWH